MRFYRILVALMLVIAGVVSTVGSGGGGGGGGYSFDINDCVGTPAFPKENCQPRQPPEPAPDLITADNAQDVSATVVQAIEQLFDVATTMGGQIFPNPLSVENLLSGHSKYALFETVLETGEPLTDACAVSGTLTVQAFNNNHPTSLSVGDVFGLVYDACDDGDGYIIDGESGLKVWELEGDPRTDVFRLKYILLGMDLTIDSGMDAYTASSGTFFLEWDSLSFPEIVLTPEPDNSQLSSQDDIYSWISGSSQSLTLNADLSFTATLREASIPGMGSAFLGGSLTYETIIPLQAADDQGPESGEVLISQTYRDGTIRMVIESRTSVRLEIDSDGDGTVEDTQFTTWAELQG